MQSALICLFVFLAVLTLITKPLGIYMLPIAQGNAPRFLASFDRILMRVFLINPTHQQSWVQYMISLLFFNVAGLVLLYLILRFQGFLPLNPMGFEGMEAYQAFNTAVSFVTNTNWQSYGGESTLSYFSQMAGLTVQNYVSAASGIAVAFVLMRAFAYKETKLVGNFFADLVRICIYILLPICFIYALFLVNQGVIQNFLPYVEVNTLADAKQQIAMGPVASQEAIKLLGTNGGGFFNANSSHPFENPTEMSNLFECLSIFAIAAALTYTFGALVKDTRQGWTIYAAMTVLFVCFTVGIIVSEHQVTPDQLKVEQSQVNVIGADSLENGLLAVGENQMNMEGKEVRFDLGHTALFTAVTTSASCGAVNNMHDSLTPIGGLFPTLLMQLGEIVFGGVGAGFYGIMIFCLIAVFIAGLMVGRTPEYLGKKITVQQMKLACLGMLTTPLIVLIGVAISMLYPSALESLNNPSAHGFSEILYAFSSAANNNGSAFAGLNANTPFYNISLGVAMFLGRFVIIACIMALAGSLITQKIIPASSGTLQTYGVLFMGLIVGTILLIGALTYIPALALGPIAEHLMLWH